MENFNKEDETLDLISFNLDVIQEEIIQVQIVVELDEIDLYFNGMLHEEGVIEIEEINLRIEDISIDHDLVDYLDKIPGL